MTETISGACLALLAPPGAEGSGRVRYAAAMTLYHAGRIDADQLEAYRIASPMDAELPLRVMVSRGVVVPGATALAALRTAAATHLQGLPGEGPANVCAMLPAATTATAALSANAVVAAHLPAAIAAMRPTLPALSEAILAAAPWLDWTTYVFTDPRIGPHFPVRHAFAPLACGADSELGIFLIAPRTLYRDHAHAAPELYVPLTGPHRWRFAPDTPFTPGTDPVWNPPHRPHAILTGDVPFLCLYGWTQDANEPSYVIPAADWTTWE